MALHDSSPERRNLTVLAFSIIVFFMAKGSFTSNVVRLQVINVEFAKPEILVYFVWGLLVWFVFRYWLTNQGDWKKAFYTEIKKNSPMGIFQRHLTKRFGLVNDYSHSYYENRHLFSIDGDPHSGLSFNHIYKEVNGSQKRSTIKADTFMDKAFILICTLYMIIRKPTLSGYFMPYILTIWAVALGVSNAL